MNEAHQGLVGDWNLDNQAERILYYKEFIKQNPDSKESLRWYIESLLRVGRCDEAEKAIEMLEALYKKRGKNNPRAGIYRAKLLWERGKHEEAIIYFEKLKEKYPDNWLIWNCAADTYAKACLYEKAIDCYKRSMDTKQKPRYTDAPMAIAQICEIIDDNARAVEAWKMYINVLNEDWNTTEGVCIDRANKKIRELGNM